MTRPDLPRAARPLFALLAVLLLPLLVVVPGCQQPRPADLRSAP